MLANVCGMFDDVEHAAQKLQFLQLMLMRMQGAKMQCMFLNLLETCLAMSVIVKH